MHEMTLTRTVVDMVVGEAQAAGASKVLAVHLTIGAVRDIVESLFEGMFAHMARGTVAQDAELVITRVPLMVRCNRCGNIYHIDTHDQSTWPCRECGERDYGLHSGMEFFIDGLELVADEDGRGAGGLTSR